MKMYEHTYVYHRPRTGSVLCVKVVSPNKEPATWVEGFNDFQVNGTVSKELPLMTFGEFKKHIGENDES